MRPPIPAPTIRTFGRAPCVGVVEEEREVEGGIFLAIGLESGAKKGCGKGKKKEM